MDQNLECSVCHKRYTTPARLANHMKRHEQQEATALDISRDLQQIAQAVKLLAEMQVEDHQRILKIMEREENAPNEAAQVRATAQSIVNDEVAHLQERRRIKYDMVANAPKAEVIVAEDTDLTVNGFTVHLKAGIPTMVPEPIKEVLYQNIAQQARAESRRKLLSSLGNWNPTFWNTGGSYPTLQAILGQQKSEGS
jgi:hypothetical protein